MPIMLPATLIVLGSIIIAAVAGLGRLVVAWYRLVPRVTEWNGTMKLLGRKITVIYQADKTSPHIRWTDQWKLSVVASGVRKIRYCTAMQPTDSIVQQITPAFVLRPRSHHAVYWLIDSYVFNGTSIQKGQFMPTAEEGNRGSGDYEEHHQRSVWKRNYAIQLTLKQ